MHHVLGLVVEAVIVLRVIFDQHPITTDYQLFTCIVLIDRPEGGGFRIPCTEHSGSLCHDASVGRQGSRPCSLRQTYLIYWEKYQYGEMQWLIQLPIPV